MSLYCISDPHLSLSCDKPMDVFGGRWQDYVQKLETNWKECVKEEDTVVIPGDISWGMNLNQSLADFAFINSLPGKEKIILKGNHDYFWTSRVKMESFFEENSLNTLKILHNNFFPYDENYGICGSRGWINENGKAQDKKILDREALRLEASIKPCVESGREPLVFLHYPPIYAETVCNEIYDVIKRYGVKKVFYGHIHGLSYRYAIDGVYDGIDFRLVSCDYLEFKPVKIF
ncbi:MAG: serine/threonine protein phosphatase [Ruminococcaceae bacterium]|nr:serine/threonine protein phosphatase [Oscillospiraceae bacterium]